MRVPEFYTQNGAISPQKWALIASPFFDYSIAVSTKNCYYCNMIHKFSISNFHSVREEVVLDLRIPGTAPDLPRFRRSTAKPDIRLPSVVVLIGPNGSGKTTLLSGLVATALIASFASPTAKSNPIKAFLPYLTKKTVKEPTRFCMEFEMHWQGEVRQLFRYELAVVRGGATDSDDPFFFMKRCSISRRAVPGVCSSAVLRENLYTFRKNLVLNPGMIASWRLERIHLWSPHSLCSMCPWLCGLQNGWKAFLHQPISCFVRDGHFRPNGDGSIRW